MTHLPDSMVGRHVGWVAPGTGRTGSGVVIADWRGTRTEDVISRQPTVSNLLLVEDDRGVRHSVPDWWIEKWND